MRSDRFCAGALLLAIVCGGLVHADLLRLKAQEPAPAAAQEIDPTLFSELRWRSIGPARGGRSIAAAGSNARPLEYYFGATGGGLWKTTDGGLTWRAVADRSFKTS